MQPIWGVVMTSLLAVIRHGPTEWNELGKIQGRTDIPLSERGKCVIRRLQLPDFVSEIDWITSPLSRAIETGKLLGITQMLIDDRLIETNWGDWEGHVLRDLRAKYGQEMLNNEKRGLDLTPPKGESPRQVCQRLQPLLLDIAASHQQKLIGAITHKGVIRSLLSLATGWNMSKKPPIRLDWDAIHIFSVDGKGTVKPHQLNVKFDRRTILS